MTKYAKAIWSIMICMIILIAFCGCTMPPPNSSKPDVQVSPIASPTVESTQHTAMPQKTLKSTPEAAMPAADANGHRTYRWHDQIVEDWLGDSTQASVLRSMLLARLDGEPKKDYYILFLGRPLAIEGGLLLPAGKRTDGEWLPSVYHIAEDSTGFHIMGKAENYVWTLNRTYTLLPNGECTSFFGYAKILGADSSVRNVLAEATFADGTKTQADIPQGYPYLLLAHSGDSQITDLAYFDAQSGTPLKMLDIMDGYDWSVHKGLQQIAVLHKNISMAPMFDIANNLPWENVPLLQRVNGTDQYEENGTIYAAGLHDSAHVLRAVASAPLEQVAMERPIPVHIGSAGRVRLAIESKDWGTPTEVSAVLYLQDGTTRELALKNGEIDTGKLTKIDWCMIYVHADFGTMGWIEWVIHLGE